MPSATVPITKNAISHVIGPKGSTVKAIKADTGITNLDIEDGVVTIEGPDDESVAAAKEKVEKIIAEQADPDYEGPEGKRLRAEADAAAKERSRLMDEATAKFDAGDKDAGHALMKEAKAAGALMEEKSAEAARVILEHRNGGKGDAYLDLHGLRVKEAIGFVEERIAAVEAKYATGAEFHLQLIPGAGHHSAPGKVALKPACEDLMKERGFNYEVVNAGTFDCVIIGKCDGGEEAPTPFTQEEDAGEGAPPAAAAAAVEKAKDAAEKAEEEVKKAVEAAEDSPAGEAVAAGKEKAKEEAKPVTEKVEDAKKDAKKAEKDAKKAGKEAKKAADKGKKAAKDAGVDTAAVEDVEVKVEQEAKKAKKKGGCTIL